MEEEKNIKIKGILKRTRSRIRGNRRRTVIETKERIITRKEQKKKHQRRRTQIKKYGTRSTIEKRQAEAK